MNIFHYRALDRRGQLCAGEFAARDAGELEQALQQLELELISASTVGLWHRLCSARQRLTRNALIEFCFQLEQLLDAGVAAADSLRALSEGDTALARLAAALLDDIEHGQPLSVAASRQARSFPPGLLALLRAGEESGDLAQALRHIGHSLEDEDRLARYAQRIAIYPLILSLLLVLTLVVALTQVIPELEQLFHSNSLELPWQTRSLLALSAFTLSYGLPLLASLFLLGLGLGLALIHLPAVRHSADALLLRLPLFGPLLNKIALARVAALLARLYAAGINLLDALQLAADCCRNQRLHAAIVSARQRIEQGHSLSQAFAAEALFPPLVETMLRIGEYSGRLDSALNKLAQLYLRDIDHAVARLQALLEPVLTIALGALLLWIASAILGPVYALINDLPL